MNWYLTVLKKYAVFSGRARRQEYWFFTLFSFIITAVLVYIDFNVGPYGSQTGLGFLSGLYSLAVFIPTFAVTVRRLHDTSRTGWWLLIGFIPLIGAIVLLVFMFLDSTSGTNEYGLDPKGPQD
jgi:uncharacterized membrane protein YhaH (DUF805 family)